MTLKTRLTVMMIGLLVAVMAVQALLMQREQRVLVDRLEALTREIDETTRGFSESTLEIFAEADSSGIRRVLERRGVRTVRDSIVPEQLLRDLDLSAPPDSGMHVVVIVEEDSTHTRLEADSEEALRRLDESPVIRRFLRTNADFRLLEHGPDSTRAARWNARTTGPDTVVQMMFTGSSHFTEDEQGRDHVFKVHLPYPGGQVELLYPAAGIAEELSRARRRSWYWLAALLGVGATGAVAVAFQFTRPFRKLESSFERVVGGDLDVRVDPERPDEVGRLTDAFNLMVARLRDKREIEGRLEEAERLASVGRLAAGVAHEVRNPLNAMRLTLAQLGDKTAPRPGTEERESFDRYVGMVTSELERLERLVSTFLDLSRDDTPVRERVDLSVLLRESLRLPATEAEGRGVALHVDVAEGLVVTGDPGRLPTVWGNLVANAFAAVEPGGKIRVTAARDGADVVLEVADDGSGIDPDVLPRIWEPFFSGRRDGTGLGLSLVRAIVERHGGRAEAASRPGRGARMTVRLPAEEEA